MLTSFTTETAKDDPKTKDRDKINDQYKWNLADLYSSVEAWEKEKQAFPARFEKVASFQGKLSSSPASLYEALRYMEDVLKDLFKFTKFIQNKF